MAEIRLTRGFCAIVDDADFASLSQFKWRAGTHGSRGSVCAVTGHKTTYMHRLIMGAGKNQFVDHINGNALDNRRANLRLCDRIENQRNRRSISNKYGFKGVSKTNEGRFFASIRLNKKAKHLGVFETAEQAARAYDAAATLHFGKFAATNQQLGKL